MSRFAEEGRKQQLESGEVAGVNSRQEKSAVGEN